jgi:hypothetical protein
VGGDVGGILLDHDVKLVPVGGIEGQDVRPRPFVEVDVAGDHVASFLVDGQPGKVGLYAVGVAAGRICDLSEREGNGTSRDRGIGQGIAPLADHEVAFATVAGDVSVTLSGIWLFPCPLLAISHERIDQELAPRCLPWLRWGYAPGR